MANDVLNFSWRPGVPIQIHPDLRVGLVPSSIAAVEAAEIAERNGCDVLIVTKDGTPAGAFFRDYLREILPSRARVGAAGVTLSPTASLPEMIRLIDQSGLDFHSELVNIEPTLFKCPNGHVTSANPCPRHHVATTPY